jgi:DNA-binding response OmpR family regulator
MPGPARILVVEDEARIAEVVQGYLEGQGHTVDRAASGEDALAAAVSRRPDLVVLDLGLPGMSGQEVCRRLRAESDVPIIMLTARDAEEDLVRGLGLGADDYLTKPFSLRELAVRVKAILRRVERATRSTPAEPLVSGSLSIDPQRRRVFVGDNEVPLTPLEFDILITLAREPGVVFSRETLMDQVWGYRDYAGGRVVDSHVARIRRKLVEEGAGEGHIRTVHGVGYAFTDE